MTDLSAETEKVKDWILQIAGMEVIAERLLKEEFNGSRLLFLDTEDFEIMHLDVGSATQIIQTRDELVKLQKEEREVCKSARNTTLPIS